MYTVHGGGNRVLAPLDVVVSVHRDVRASTQGFEGARHEFHVMGAHVVQASSIWVGFCELAPESRKVRSLV